MKERFAADLPSGPAIPRSALSLVAAALTVWAARGPEAKANVLSNVNSGTTHTQIPDAVDAADNGDASADSREGRDPYQAAFETFRVDIKSFWAWNRTLIFKGDGTYTFEMQTLEKVSGEERLGPSKTPYVTSYRLSPGDLWELTQLLKATQWLSTRSSPHPVATDTTEYTLTLRYDERTARRTYHDMDNVQAYVDLVRFLRRVNRQENLLFAVTHRDVPFPAGDDLSDELDGVMGVGNRARPYAPALDYHRLVPAYAEFLAEPGLSPRLTADAAKLMGYLKLESQRKNLEALAAGRAPGDGPSEVPSELRIAAINALGMMGAGQSLDALRKAGQVGGHWVRDAVAEALMSARSDKVIPILKELASESPGAAWALSAGLAGG